MVPKYHEFYSGILKFLDNGKEREWVTELIPRLIILMRISKADEDKILQYTRQNLLHSRVGWACRNLENAGLVVMEKQGYIKITAEGKKFYEQHEKPIEPRLISQLKKDVVKLNNENYVEDIFIDQTPDDLINACFEKFEFDTKIELKHIIQKLNPHQFEKLITEVFNEIFAGYGGVTTSKTRDGGIDGFINMDKLGLDKTYLQAKHYDNKHPIGVGDIERFFGSLNDKRSSKGVFVTTSKFTKVAYDYCDKNQIIKLIDGDELVDLMYDDNIGVNIKDKFMTKNIDHDFFDSIK